jgi:hypothetical protein
MRYIMIMWVFICQSVMAHEWTPTYPVPEMSHIEDVLKVEMKLFNNRENVEYFEIGVFDEDWNKVPFALQNGQVIVRAKYQERKFIDVYIRNKDIKSATYVCSQSKLLQEDETKPLFFSRICSKIK